MILDPQTHFALANLVGFNFIFWRNYLKFSLSPNILTFNHGEKVSLN